MPREEEKGAPPEGRAMDRLQFREVRDSEGRMVCRVSPTGIVEVRYKQGGNRKRPGARTFVFNIWEYLEE